MSVVNQSVGNHPPPPIVGAVVHRIVAYTRSSIIMVTKPVPPAVFC